jgi:hypothetical protein
VRRGKLLAAGLIQEAPLTPVQVAAAEAVFAGNALSLRAVVALDGHVIPAGNAMELS